MGEVTILSDYWKKRSSDRPKFADVAAVAVPQVADGLSADELLALAVEGQQQPLEGTTEMNVLMWLFAGGWAKNYRTQLLGMVTALTAVMDGMFKWAVGDGSLGDLVTTVGANWEAIVAGLAIWFAGDKLNTMMGKPAAVGEKK